MIPDDEARAAPARARRIAGRGAAEVAAQAGPAPQTESESEAEGARGARDLRGAPTGRFSAALRSAYDRLFEALRAAGSAPQDVVADRLFFSDIGAQAAEAETIRRLAYAAAGRSHPPASTWVQQPPATGAPVEIQAHALAPRDGSPLSIVPLNAPAGRGDLEAREGAVARFHLAGVTAALARATPFSEHAAAMFARAEEALARRGLRLRDVARTWIHLADVDRDYVEFNAARRALYEARRLRPAPASTGIEGGLHPPDRLCSLDLVAFQGPGVRFEPMHALTMNEAPTYGSDFSRGMRVTLPSRVLLYVSGTASIDDEGRVLHPGDARAQMERMLLNVRELLAAQGAGLGDLLSAVTYLQSASDRGPLAAACREAGLPDDLPHAVAVARICRPDWLCEMEAVAVLA